MKLYDVSMMIHEEMPVYKNREEKRPILSFLKTHEKDGYTESRIAMDIHTGTHIDAPLHMVDNGDTIEKINLLHLITPCQVIDLSMVKDRISEKDLKKKKIDKGTFILLKTRNSMEDYFNIEFIYLSKSGASYLESLKIKGVGIDSLGIERAQKNHMTHQILMRSGIIIIEGLRLKEVPEGDYFMYALPLKIRGADGSPARVILMKE